MSLKSFPWVFENMDVPKNVQDDVWWLGEPQGSFIKKISQSDIRIHFEEYTQQFFGSRTPKINLLNPKGVNSYLFYPWDKMVYSKKT